MGFCDPNMGQMPPLRQVLRGIAVEAGKEEKFQEFAFYLPLLYFRR